MPRLDRVPQATRNNILTRAVEINVDTPFTAPRRPISQARLALVTTAGLHLRDDQPFVHLIHGTLPFSRRSSRIRASKSFPASNGNANA